MTEHEGNAPACRYFALCDREADGIVRHPILGDVPTCERCADRVGEELIRPEDIAPTCPDCGEPIERTDSGAWWRHVGLPGECWRMSMDGPNIDA